MTRQKSKTSHRGKLIERGEELRLLLLEGFRSSTELAHHLYSLSDK